MDRVDLHVAEVLDGGAGGGGSVAEGDARVEPLGAEPDSPGLGRMEGVERVEDCARHASGV
jgi:hypothetical protein